MKTSFSVGMTVLAAAVAFAACGGNNNEADAGVQVDAGFDAGVDAGVDAGLPDAGLKSCTPGGMDCTAGESCLFIDVGNNNLESFCLSGACDLVAQNCPSGQSCDYQDVNGQTQRACGQPGTAMEGQPCSMTGCVAGFACVIGQDQVAACRKYCNIDSDCPADRFCIQPIAPGNTDERPFVCVEAPPTCDPLLQDCPNATDGCFLTNTGATCAPAGNIQPGQPCSTGMCVKGATCLGLADGGTECAMMCGFPSSQPTCPMGQQCAQLRSPSGPVLDGGVGACL